MNEKEAIKHQIFTETLSLYGAIYIRKDGAFINIAQVIDIHNESVNAPFDPNQDYFIHTTRETPYYEEAENTEEHELFGTPLEVRRYYFRKL